jgi:hypothetical protein
MGDETTTTKPKRGSRQPPNTTRISYYLDNDSVAKMQKLAKDDDRELADYARRAAKQHADTNHPHPVGAAVNGSGAAEGVHAPVGTSTAAPGKR